MNQPLITTVNCPVPACVARPFHLKYSDLMFAGLVIAVAMIAPQGRLAAEGLAPVDLRSAAPFTILAATAITTTGGGTIAGNVGLSPGGGTGMGVTDALVAGKIYVIDAAGPAGSVIAPALLNVAKGHLSTAFDDAAGRLPVPTGAFLNPGDGNMGGMTLGSGLYKFTTTASITGSDLTLTGGPDEVWIFQLAADLQVGNGMAVILAGGALARNIFWQVGSSAVIGTTAQFKGTILAFTSITMNTGSTLEGAALASNGAVTYNGSGGVLPTPAPPYFTSISRTAGGEVTVVLKTTPYFLLTLETSTDLLPGSWSEVTTATPQTSPWTFIHSETLATGPKRFYRASLTSYSN